MLDKNKVVIENYTCADLALGLNLYFRFNQKDKLYSVILNKIAIPVDEVYFKLVDSRRLDLVFKSTETFRIPIKMIEVEHGRNN